MFVALSRFTIANDMAADVHAAFRARPQLVDQQPGVFAAGNEPRRQSAGNLARDSSDGRRKLPQLAPRPRTSRVRPGIPKRLLLMPQSAGITHFDRFAIDGVASEVPFHAPMSPHGLQRLAALRSDGVRAVTARFYEDHRSIRVATADT